MPRTDIDVLSSKTKLLCHARGTGKTNATDATDVDDGCPSENAMSRIADQKFGRVKPIPGANWYHYSSLKWCGGGGKIQKQPLEYAECHLEPKMAKDATQ